MKRFCYTTFCDDVRQEASGKISYMGVYGPQMLLNGQKEVRILKLNIVMTLITEPTDVYRNMKFIIEIPNREAIYMETIVDKWPPIEKDAFRNIATAISAIENHVFHADSTIRTFVEIDGERIEGDRLQILQGVVPQVTIK